MNSVFQLMEKMCAVEGTVLITGESGTGKELAARAIHFNSSRKDGPFVVVNCGAVPKDLIESEFFGHVKGAFTDAKTEKTGKFERAHRGTIFLDEVGELSQDAQVKLLRALGEREIIKVGGTQTIPVDVRVIAATNKHLEEQVERGNFREDLFYRLAVLSLHLPALRDRSEDIPLLCEHFMRKYSTELDKEMKGVSRQALDVLASYAWPGNVRELENVVYEAMVMVEGGWLDEGGLPSRIKMSGSGREKGTSVIRTGQSLRAAAKGAAEEAERELIRKVLREAGGNRTRAAASLGVSRKTLFNKMAAFGIKWPE
jgi:DNA-binding NtrC family response regulator